ncbi:serine/threonine-protein phosphatase with EF-hands 2-like [Salvelinus alpinus]
MPQNACVPSEVWGGGCSWGPDVTQGFLNRHNMQLISRSHECKQDGHNRRCEVGSNRGAYMKLGPDLVPYLIQYQASTMTRELTLRKNVRKAGTFSTQGPAGTVVFTQVGPCLCLSRV